MKVKDLKVFIVGNPPPSWGGRYFIFVKLTTDNGITGIGECYCDTFGPKAMTAMIEDTFGRYVEGMDPFHLESLWRKVYGSGFSQRPDISLMGVLSGIEIALWDINGKAREQAGLRTARRPRAREAALLHLHLSRSGQGPGRLDLLERRTIGRARGALCEAAASPPSSSIPRPPIPPSIRASPRSSRSISA